MSKTCTQCKTEKEAHCFYKRAASKDGLQLRCKKCQTEARSQWQRDNSAKRMEAKKAYRSLNGDKDAAHTAVQFAVKTGALVKPKRCHHCHLPKGLEAHHYSYRPEHFLDVLWLCRGCHLKVHRDDKE